MLRERDALKEANKRLEHLVAELNHAVHGKWSEKLSEDDRQLAFEDIEIAVAEAEEKQETQAPSESQSRRTARRNRGNLPADAFLHRRSTALAAMRSEYRLIRHARAAGKKTCGLTMHLRQNLSIREIARSTSVSRKIRT